MTDKAREIVLAFLNSGLMDEARDYVQRGRRFEAVPTPELNEIWIASYRGVVGSFRSGASGGPEMRDHDDASAEFRIRGVEPPIEAVLLEINVLQKLVEPAVPKLLPALEEKLDDFLADWVQPKN